MFLTKNKKLGFIHIPKTGGTSILQAFKDYRQDEWQPKNYFSMHSNYNHYYSNTNLKDIPEQWFTIVRHPIARVQSYYYYQIKYDKKRINGKLPLKTWTKTMFEERVKIFETLGIDHMLQQTKDFSDQMHLVAPDNKEWNKHTRKLLKPQHQYIENCENIKVFKLENINECYNWLKDEYDIEIPYTHIKVGNKDKLHWTQDLSAETIQVLTDRYRIDFEMFDYELPTL